MSILNRTICCIECYEDMFGIPTRELRTRCWKCSGSPVLNSAPPTMVDKLRARAADYRSATRSYITGNSGTGGHAA